MKSDIHSQVPAAIVAQLEAGVAPWSRPWTSVGGNRHLRANGQPYKGINTLVLALSGRPGGHWFTYKQASELGAQVRGGEKSTSVVFFKPLKVEDKANAGQLKTIPLLRSYNVFHQDQIDNLPAKYTAPAVARMAATAPPASTSLPPRTPWAGWKPRAPTPRAAASASSKARSRPGWPGRSRTPPPAPARWPATPLGGLASPDR